MNNLIPIKQLYPDCEGENQSWFNAPYDYNPLLYSIGNVLLKVDDQDYQGDSRLIYHNPNTGEFGLLIFGWGSCSGCAALQACGSYEDVDKLRTELQQKIQWYPSARELFNYFEIHDWTGDYSWHAEETRHFIEEAKKLLKELI